MIFSSISAIVIFNPQDDGFILRTDSSRTARAASRRPARGNHERYTCHRFGNEKVIC